MSNQTAVQKIHDALIDAGIDLERVRSDSAVYYPDLLPRFSRVATQPEVIDAVRSIRSEAHGVDGETGAAEVDPCEVYGVLLSIGFVAAPSASIL